MTEQSNRAQVKLVILLLLCATCITSPAQQKDASQPGATVATTTQTQPPADTPKNAETPTQKPAATPMTPAEARQAQLLADTERLYQLTQELKEEVAKSNKDTLSVPVVKKAEEVEKLARSLKERMRTSQ